MSKAKQNIKYIEPDGEFQVPSKPTPSVSIEEPERTLRWLHGNRYKQLKDMGMSADEAFNLKEKEIAEALTAIESLIAEEVVKNVKRELFNIVDPGDGGVYSLERIGRNASDRLKRLESKEDV